MDSLHPQMEDLIANIDDLESALSTITSTALSTSTSKLPLLDKAKLYVLATYAIESILFSYLRVNGVDAKEHPVFKELNRVKEYFGKIKAAEDVGAGGGAKGRLDKDAAGRFIKHGLAGNEKYDREREETRQRERMGAKRKFEALGVGTHTRFDGNAKRIGEGEEESVKVVKADQVDSDEDEDVYRSGQGRNTKAKKKKGHKSTNLEFDSMSDSKSSVQDEKARLLADVREKQQELPSTISGNMGDADNESTTSKKKKKNKTNQSFESRR